MERNQNRPDRPPRRRKKRRTGLRIMGGVFQVLGTLILIGVITCAILACFATVYIRTVIMPQAEVKLTEYDLNLSSHLYYVDPQTGERVQTRTLYKDENRVWVPYEEIPEDLVNAAIAIEDRTFRTNSGVNWKRTVGALGNMFLQMRDTYGGSTITQQVVKNTTGRKEGTVKRKILEIFSALELNNNYSKETIMEQYLNIIFLGEGCNGVYTAAYTYFGKHVSELSLAECASLIGITNNPSLYDPYLPLETVDEETGEVRTNKIRNKERQETILSEMKKQGLITEEEYDAAVEEELVFQRGSAGEAPKSGAYTWYEDQVISEVLSDLKETFYLSEDAAALMLYNGGLEIEMCVNPQLQAIVDSVYENEENLNYTSATGQKLQSAIVIIDNATGDIVALSGGMGEKTGSRWHNRATQSVRQPGSSIKPVAVYAPAVELGVITPATVIDDAPINLDGSAWPRNSYGHYRGRMTVFEAVEDSANTIAVRVLRDYITPQVSYDFMTGKLGFTTLVAGRQNSQGKVFSDIDLSPLSLGGLTDGVTVREMAAAYSVFPRLGMYIQPRTYVRVVDANGTVVLSKEPEKSVAMKESAAFYMNYMLKNVVAAGTGYEARFNGMTMAGKTGTTTKNFDRWFVGYTPYYTAAVWTGYDQNEQVKVTGNPAARMWKQVMSQIHENLENRDFDKPAEGTVSRQYCIDSGMLPNDYCALDGRGSRVRSGQFAAGDAPTQYCTMHVPAEMCTDDPIVDAEGNFFLDGNKKPLEIYRLAGEFCPEESRTTVGVLDYTRNTEGLTYACKDDNMLLGTLQAMGTCQVHTSAPEPTPPVIDPNDPSTWPWGYEPPSTGEPAPTPMLPWEGASPTPAEPTPSPEGGWHWPWEESPSPTPEPVPIDTLPAMPVPTGVEGVLGPRE